RGGQGSPPGGGEAAVDASAGGLQIPKPHDVGAPKSHARRDLLLRIQLAAQHRWEEEKVFEADADADADATDEGSGAKKSKYFVTFPYPYMNGLLHLGHAFSLTKAEFAVAFQRMQGKRCLWPFAFHCTGMPIQAAADTLRRELAAAGEVPDTDAGLAGDLAAVSLGRGEPTAPLTAHAGASAADAGGALEGAGAGGRYQSGKSKVAAKKGNAKTQAEVLRAMGVAEEDIGAFARADKWLDYFPQLAREDLRAMGLKIDWRRTFITTEASPWYDAFVRWQFRKLKALQKVKFGKRFSIFSPLDNQICADHDRASGEGVGAQEYTLIRMELVTLPPALEMLAGKTVVLLAATLRPETMYGQTNCWVLPDGDYGAFEMADGSVLVMCDRAARNL
ncbi:MAG: class I tRNA ligase family protein, partial [Promethearchaeia archaeon]